MVKFVNLKLHILYNKEKGGPNENKEFRKGHYYSRF